MESYKRSIGINLIGWCVCLSNILLFVSYYYVILTHQTPAPTKFITFLSFTAVFPLDFFHSFMPDMWTSHFCWMLIMITCGMGILLLNRLTRLVFIVVNIVHAVLFAYLTYMHYGQWVFLEYCFKFYLIIVVSVTYVGFLTIQDVREQFKIDLEGMKFTSWFHKGRLPQSQPKSSHGYYNLALAYNKIGRYSDAVQSLEKAVAIEPDNVKILYQLAVACGHLERNHEAIGALKKACGLDPGNFEAANLLGQMYMEEGCLYEAVVALELAAKIRPKQIDLNKNLGKAYLSVNQYDKAMDAFQRTINLESSDAEVFYLMGVIYKDKLNKLRESRAVLLRAVKIRPEYTEAQFKLGVVCSGLERYKDAIRSLKEAIRLDPEHKEAHYQLGFAYAMIKDFDSARREYQFLRRIDCDLADDLEILLK